MKIRKYLPVLFGLFAGAILIGGCSGNNSGGGSTGQSISGIVSDPAIEGADVILVKPDGTLAKISAKSDSEGQFVLEGVPMGVLSGWWLKTAGGADKGTGQDFVELELCLPMDLYAIYDNVVVSPITCLVKAAMEGSDINAAVAKVKLHLGDIDLTANPSEDPVLLILAMKLTLMASEGRSFQEILDGLDPEAGLDIADLEGVFTDAAIKDSLAAFFALLDSVAGNADTLAEAYQREIIERAIRGELAAELDALTDSTEIANADVNIDALVEHLMTSKDNETQPRHYLTEADVIATISAGAALDISQLTQDPADFDPTLFRIVLVDRSTTFSDSLKLAFYRVDNPNTGNDQLVVYDGVTGIQTVVKTNVIIGERAFVLEGDQVGDTTHITGKKYGLFLDPNSASETRVGEGDSGPFEYLFFLDNELKRYDIATPSNENVVFNSSMLDQSLISQGIQALFGEYTLHNNISDADNSYVDLTAFEALPDANRSETGEDKFQVPITARLVDGKMVQGRMIRILKDGAGLTESVLINFVAVHKPSGEAPARQLQACASDLSACSNIDGGVGNFFFLTENDTHLYLAKDGDSAIYAFDKSTHALGTVTGVAYPAAFDNAVHLLGTSGHGGGGILSDFSSLAGANTYLSDGLNAYLAINYDLDTQDKVGVLDFGFFASDVFVKKHGQILKLTGTTGVKMFDNGDGVDHGDLSDGEAAVGHLNLISVQSDGKLFVESGNYDGGGSEATCDDPDDNGLNCSSVKYGYLDVTSIGMEVFDLTLIERSGLPFFTARRIAPVGIGDRLFISIVDPEETDAVVTYTLHAYRLSDAVKEDLSPLSAGRTFITKSAERPNGVFEGEVIAWDGATGLLNNISLGIEGLGNPQDLSDEDPALSSVFGRSSGVPLAGIGNLFALRAHNGDHQWHLFAGLETEVNGVVYVDQVPTSAWLYE